jgi:hypothetical protein
MFTHLLAALAVTAGPAESVDEPIRLHPRAPHYLEFRGKPTVLVTSGEHYGAVLNLDLEFVPYLETLARDGLNLTRTFSGTYREVAGSFNIRDNTLAPKPNRYLAPWVRVRPAEGDRPESFDLDRFEPAYFERMKAFLTEAGRRGIVVELSLFCPLYEDVLWAVNPMNARNNTNQLAECPREEVYTLKHPELLARQRAFVRKVVTELNEFDNLYFEICNEPYFGGVTLEWQGQIAREISDTENGLAKRHLIAQNIANKSARVEAPVHPAVKILNFHYAEPSAALDNYRLDLVLGDDETGFVGTDDAPYRREGWLFLLSGGSVYSNLDYSFTPAHADGALRPMNPTPGGGGPELREELSVLKRFLDGFDLLRLKPDPSVVRRGLPDGARLAVLTEPGRQYALYLDTGKRAELSLALPAGTYSGSWIDPVTGERLRIFQFTHDGGDRVLPAIEFREDVAMKLTRDGDH